MKKINSIKFIDSLAEITRYRDREVIERSLLKTLLEFETESCFRLYQVLSCEPELKMGILAYANGTEIITTEHIKHHALPAYFHNALMQVINNAQITTINSEEKCNEKQTIYPAFDANDEIFAILVQTAKKIDPEIQRFVHSLLRIYSNYLEMIEVTKRDKLTGLLNRETLESEITRILISNNQNEVQMVMPDTPDPKDQRAQRGWLTYWLCVLDIDHFKSINDQYGHIYGDEILILVARLLEKSVREFDKIFRFGGEEFVILVKAHDNHDALRAFERIRDVIATHQYAKISTLTVSIGGIEITHQPDPRNVIEAADSALYFAKNNGRNQVHLYEDLVAKNKIVAQKNEINDSEIDFF
ncbi:GGDEF domain-containing protein [Psychromonas sp. psych-6C06]|uniref:GGDEF domain-containing protein n=1 Tax=Psychromonas sp. psych-6C06 TaxID=2058089 RepID=UPI000C32F8FB|nr:GGDEF domain-containing protein [Psychromonas sp. psych-6C06]PKF62187.1 GGDEF domain-containing protein [Psychromonas sp. psych-6C06]